MSLLWYNITMTIPFERPDWTDEASRFAALQSLGFDTEQAALFAAEDTQIDQAVWDQTHQDPTDSYSVLEGSYRIGRSLFDPNVITLERGDVESYPVVLGGDYSGEVFSSAGETPLEAKVARLGQTTLHYSAGVRLTYEVLALQFADNPGVYPALGRTIVYSGDDYGDGGACYQEDEVAHLGYVHPGLFEPKERKPLPFLVAGRDYYRPGFELEETSDGSTFVIEPDGTRWLRDSSSGLSYNGPDDMAGYYPE